MISLSRAIADGAVVRLPMPVAMLCSADFRFVLFSRAIRTCRRRTDFGRSRLAAPARPKLQCPFGRDRAGRLLARRRSARALEREKSAAAIRA